MPFRALPGSAEHGPCLRCLFLDKLPFDLVLCCEIVGIFGVVVGVLGMLQVIEVLKELFGFGDFLSGCLLMYDAFSSEMRIVKLKCDFDCRICGVKVV